MAEVGAGVKGGSSVRHGRGGRRALRGAMSNDDPRAARLAAALRANLHRRKAQSRATGDAATSAPSPDPDAPAPVRSAPDVP